MQPLTPLSLAVLLNFVRDFVWAYWTAQKWGLLWTVEEDLVIQDVGQYLAATLAMLAVLLLLSAFHAIEYRLGAVTLIAASLGIVPWSMLEELVERWLAGPSVGMSASVASLSASWAPGLGEGPVQYLVLYVLEDRKDLFFFGLLLSVTAGSVPGNVWQLSYALVTFNRNSNAKWVPEQAALAVAVSVGISNTLYGLASARWIEKRHEKQTQRAPKELEQGLLN